MDPLTVTLVVVNLLMIGAGIGKAVEQKQDEGEEKPDDPDDGGGTWCSG